MTVNFSPVSFHGTVGTPSTSPSQIGFQFITSNPIHNYKEPNRVQKLCCKIADNIADFANVAIFRFRKLFNLKPKNLDNDAWKYLKAWDSAWHSKEVRRSIRIIEKTLKKRKIK